MNLISYYIFPPQNLVMFSHVATTRLGNKPYTGRLRRKQKLSDLKISPLHPADYVQPTTGALNRVVNLAQDSNRKAVIIHNVLYPGDFNCDSGTTWTDATSGESKYIVSEKKLRKKSPTSLFVETIRTGRISPLPLPLDYLDAQVSLHEKTYLHASALSTSRSTARQIQDPETGMNAQNQGLTARSAFIYATLSSHPLMLRDAFATAEFLDPITIDTTIIPPADVKVQPLRQKRCAWVQNRGKFKPVLESMEEKCENSENGLMTEVNPEQGSTAKDSPDRKCNYELELSNCHESSIEKCSHLKKERDIYFGKCESLERVLNKMYGNRDVLMEELKKHT